MQDAKEKLAVVEKLKEDIEQREASKSRQMSDALAEAFEKKEAAVKEAEATRAKAEQAQSSMVEMRMYLEEIQRREAQQASDHAEALRKANERAEAAGMEAARAREAEALAWREAETINSRESLVKEQVDRAKEAQLAAELEVDEYKRAAAEASRKESQAKLQEAEAVAAREAAVAAAAAAEKASADLRVALSAASSASSAAITERHTALAKRQQRTRRAHDERCTTQKARPLLCLRRQERGRKRMPSKWRRPVRRPKRRSRKPHDAEKPSECNAAGGGGCARRAGVEARRGGGPTPDGRGTTARSHA